MRAAIPVFTVTNFARAQARDKLKHVLDQMHAAAANPDDPAEIHRLRVAIRRSTQCLRVFRTIFRPGPQRKVARRLHKLMGLCGAVRTCDVALGILEQESIDRGRTVERIRSTRMEAELRLRRSLKRQCGRKAAAWKLKLETRASARSAWDLEQDLPANLRRVLPKEAEEFFAAGRAAAVEGSNVEALHHFRLRTKHFRYTLELFPSFYGDQFEQGLTALRGLQDRLGAVNDCAAMMGLIENDRRATAAVRELLVKREREFAVYWKKTFSGKRREWWLGWLQNPVLRAADL